MGRLVAAAVALTVLAGCFGPDPNLTDTGKGKPRLAVEFPETVTHGSTATATLTVDNPGPGDMASVVVAFATVGVAAASGPLPVELVPVARSKSSPVVSVTPEPSDVSDDGVVYVFGGLAEGESIEIAFEIRVPDEPGPAANSVSVYAGEDASRIAGVRLDTTVTG